MTIEQLAPQSDGSKQAGRIGNLVYVSEDLNSELEDHKWPDKRKILVKVTNQWVPDEVKKAESWRDSNIRSRTKELAELARTKVWRG